MDEDTQTVLDFLQENGVVYVKKDVWYFPENNVWIKETSALRFVYGYMVNMPYIMTNYKSAIRILNKCKPYLHNPDFEKLLDNNRNLVPFKNGVFNLQTKTFRNIELTDYISTVLQYDWSHEDDDAIQKEIRDIVNTIVGGREDIWDLLRKLITHPADKIVLLYGKLNSGRGTLVELISSSFYEFAYGFSLDELQKKPIKLEKAIEKRKVRLQCYYMTCNKFKFKCKYKDNVLNRDFGILIKSDVIPGIENGYGEDHIEVVHCPNKFTRETAILGLRAKFEKENYKQQFMRILLC